MTISTIFTRGVVTAAPTTSVADVAGSMQSHNVGAVIVEENGRPVGIATDRDLALALGVRGVALSTPIREIMTRHVLAIPDTTDIATATRYMREQHVRRLPVVDADDRLVGMVTLDDLICHLGRELSNLAEGIRTEVNAR